MSAGELSDESGLFSSDYEDVIEDITIDSNNRYHNVMETSRTLTEKHEVDRMISRIAVDKNTQLKKPVHVNYLLYFLVSNNNLPEQFRQLEASNPWILYWLINAFKTMKGLDINKETSPMSHEEILALLQTETYQKVIKFQDSDEKGGFAGGFNQLPHLATNYCSILSLLLTGNLDKIETTNMASLFESLVEVSEDGRFRVKTSKPCGEVDSRSIYCLLVAAKLLKIDLKIELLEKLWRTLLTLQSDLEGGLNGTFTAEESHGGYAYCTLCALIILLEMLSEKKPDSFSTKKLHEFVNIDRFIDWLAHRQDSLNGGLNGRNNKLVDGCYAFWIGACGTILDIYGYVNPINMARLKEYILFYCQDNKKNMPGLRDKPGKNSDFYHTNYVLLGLSLCEYDGQLCIENGSSTQITCTPSPSDGDKDVHPVNPIYAVPLYVLEKL